MHTLTLIQNLRGYADLIADSGYFPPVSAQDLSSAECYGIYDATHQLLGGVMVLRVGIHAYLEYLVVAHEHRNTGVAIKLLDGVRQILRNQQVKYVYAAINGSNIVASALIKRYPTSVGFPYFQVRATISEDDNG